MATVYLATDTKHHRPVALKVLAPELAASLGPERFRREIEIAAQLQHPHILTVLDSGETPSGQLWFTMPYVDGESLRARLNREKQLSLDDALRITREVADALEYAHQRGIIHRDIKPENILLSRGHALVADFGVARAVGAGDASDGPAGRAITETGMALGTPTYMSPEQAAGERTVDARTDTYALGCVLYEMLAGEPPYTGATTQALLAKRVSGDIPSVRRVRPAVPPGVDAALTTSLAPVPADRYVTTAEFARALDTGAATATTAALPRVKRRLPMGAAVLGLAIFIGAAFLFAQRRLERSTQAAAGASPVSLAVLPFDNQGDTANAYFADGITGEIRGKLSTLPGLQVIATTSSNQYRHTAKPADQIGRELGVRYLLVGTVEWERGATGTRRVRVSPELVEVRDGAAPETKWRQSFDTTLANVFDVQSAVATRVADKLGVVLSPPTQLQLAKRPTQNLAAYDAYLRSVAIPGVDHVSLRHALVAAEEAVTLDSTFAAAWAQVATLHAGIYLTTIQRSRADAEAANQAAERAIALSPSAPEGYIARGAYNAYVVHDHAAAKVAFQTAVRLAPWSPDALGQLARVEAASGQSAAALEHFRQAVVLDPRSSDAASGLSLLLLSLRRYPEARAEAERGLTLAPAEMELVDIRALSLLGEGDLTEARASLRNVPPAVDRARLVVYVTTRWPGTYWALDSADRAMVVTTLLPAAFDNDPGLWGIVRAEIYWLAGDTTHARRYADSARGAFERYLRATPNDEQQRLFLGLSLAYLGQPAAAVREGQHGLELAVATGDEYANIPAAHHVLAQIYATVGDQPRALAQLDTLLATQYFLSPAWLKIDPTWAPLHGNTGFERLLTQPAPTVGR